MSELPQNSSDPALPALRLTVIRWLQVLRDRLRRGEMSIGLGGNPDNRNGLPPEFSRDGSSSLDGFPGQLDEIFRQLSSLFEVLSSNFSEPVASVEDNMGSSPHISRERGSGPRSIGEVDPPTLQTVADINNPPAEYILETIRLTSNQGEMVVAFWLTGTGSSVFMKATFSDPFMKGGAAMQLVQKGALVSEGREEWVGKEYGRADGRFSYTYISLAVTRV
ncbi:hypothetical protein R3P38DRAFT_2807246 [Favolaschia claudopus]|uniref:Uncharacterized protein n=1 Tax=Favolaschia claudopus TaxID=2862362 RepID=A0AAV9ZIU9_9AGAR